VVKEKDGRHTKERAPESRRHSLHQATLYDAIAGLLTLGSERTVREMTFKLAQVNPGERVLDVGCGTGTLTLAAKRRAGPTGEMHGVDAAPEMIDSARRQAAQAGLDVGLIEDIPFPEGQFDVGLSSPMLHHLPDDLKRQGYVEMHRTLRPGGRLLAMDLAPPGNHLLQALATLVFGHRMAKMTYRKWRPWRQKQVL
jgi:demethylmenaquinone methyltransferase/2-methoxy-6-polyprenyl-1,4-benzoquinol methylase/phosphoethanolamine N-methyltransferase